MLKAQVCGVLACGVIVALSLSVLPVQAARLTGRPADLPETLAEQTRNAVRATLAAPQTARFRRMRGYRLSDGGWAVCGAVRSRNLTGLPMPWKPVYLRYAPGDGRGLQLARRIVDWPADVACRHLVMGWPLRARD